MPEGSPLRAELREVAEIAQSTLDKVRSLSQALHPVMLDETGLESTLDWYLPVVERQAGIHISYEKSGTAYPVDGNAAIHVYRVVQEALNNVTRHSGAREAWVRLRYLPQTLEFEVEDHGSGFQRSPRSRELGWWRCGNARSCWAAPSNFFAPERRHTGPVDVPGSSERRERVACRIRFQCLLVDDHSLVRRGFRRILEDEPDIEVTGEAADGAEAVDWRSELEPTSW